MLLGLGWTARAFLINANSISNLRTHVCSPYVLKQPCYGLDCLTCCLSVFTDCVRQSYVDAPCLRKHSRLRLASVSPSHSFNAEERETVESRDVQDDAEDISNENQQGQAKISRLKGLYIVATPIGEPIPRQCNSGQVKTRVKLWFHQGLWGSVCLLLANSSAQLEARYQCTTWWYKFYSSLSLWLTLIIGSHMAKMGGTYFLGLLCRESRGHHI